jgi:Ni,Fe-hydrogenase III small subunit
VGKTLLTHQQCGHIQPKNVRKGSGKIHKTCCHIEIFNYKDFAFDIELFGVSLFSNNKIVIT